MLTSCPECNLQVSDRAITCPHCGFPLQKNAIPSCRKPTKKHMRLPNGFGQISEIRNRNLRKPFRVLVTVGVSDVGRPIVKPLQPVSYFKTYNEAYEALVKYNQNPYMMSNMITMDELYQRWFLRYTESVSASSCTTMRVAWRYAFSVHPMRVCDVKIPQIKDAIYNGYYIENGKEHRPSLQFQKQIKAMFNLLFDFALEFELTDKNYARMFTLTSCDSPAEEKDRRHHISFTEDELAVLWDAVDRVSLCDIILIECYSGWRPQELLNLKLSDVDLAQRTFIGGSKTESGKNRVVPIHSKIYPLVERLYRRAQEAGCDQLCVLEGFGKKNGCALTYAQYARIFSSTMESLRLNPAHRPHDCRKTFVTLAKQFNVDEYAIKRIVGHYISDLTERVYTDRQITWLQSEIEKIKI